MEFSPSSGLPAGIAPRPVDILAAALAWQGEGHRVALVTLVGIEGRSPRGIGTQMAVCADGRRLGSFSGGCIEAAIVAEALDGLKAGAARQVRYGVGSPYIDVRLPCGGGIDLLFTPDPDPALLRAALERLAARQVAGLVYGLAGVAATGEGFGRAYAPPLRIVAFGQGEDLTALAALAGAFGAVLDVFSPQEADLVRGGTLLRSRARPPAVALDPWSAAVFLFHDHDWEEALLPPALAQEALYHGAIGSQRTHAARLAMLERLGVPAPHIGRLRGAVGLIPATREPAMLAVSILAQVAAAHDAAARALQEEAVQTGGLVHAR